MHSEESAQAVLDLYRALLGREPGPSELSTWAAEYERQGRNFRWMFGCFARSPEFGEKTRIRPPPGHPPGHYYSPIVDPAEAAPYVAKRREGGLDQLQGVDIDLAAMKALWERMRPLIEGHLFPAHAGAGGRYFSVNPSYPASDAVVLRAMIGSTPPHQIIEIGSGFSTACMLDTAESLGLPDLRITCIEPNPERLRSLLRPGDEAALEIIARPVQTVDLARFADLHSGDILFIDSSHVLKSGSDVHYELLQIIPILQPGVRIHFHDIEFPFEYPLEWIEETKYSWNEAYAVHAFLLYNRQFKIDFFNNLFSREFRQDALAASPHFLHPGGSLWLSRA